MTEKEGKVIQKDRKYFLKFPKGTNSDTKKDYVKKIEDNLKTSRFVVIDSDIEVYDAHSYEEQKAEENKNDTGNNAETKDTGKESAEKDTNDSSSETGNDTKPSTENTEPAGTTSDAGDGATGDDDEIVVDKVESNVSTDTEPKEEKLFDKMDTDAN